MKKELRILMIVGVLTGGLFISPVLCLGGMTLVKAFTYGALVGCMGIGGGTVLSFAVG